MSRYSWDGSATAGTPVGEAQLALTGTQGFTFSWNLDGQSGSEPMIYLDGEGRQTGYVDVWTKIEMCRNHYAACGLTAHYVEQFIR